MAWFGVCTHPNLDRHSDVAQVSIPTSNWMGTYPESRKVFVGGKADSKPHLSLIGYEPCYQLSIPLPQQRVEEEEDSRQMDLSTAVDTTTPPQMPAITFGTDDWQYVLQRHAERSNTGAEERKPIVFVHLKKGRGAARR